MVNILCHLTCSSHCEELFVQKVELITSDVAIIGSAIGYQGYWPKILISSIGCIIKLISVAIFVTFWRKKRL